MQTSGMVVEAEISGRYFSRWDDNQEISSSCINLRLPNVCLVQSKGISIMKIQGKIKFGLKTVSCQTDWRTFTFVSQQAWLTTSDRIPSATIQ